MTPADQQCRTDVAAVGHRDLVLDDQGSIVDDTYSLALVDHEALRRDACEDEALVAGHLVAEVCLDKLGHLRDVTAQHHLSDTLESQVYRTIDFQVQAH